MECVVVESRNGNGAGVRTGKVDVRISRGDLVNLTVWRDEEEFVISGHN